MSTHAKLPPSSASRWTKCLASTGAIRRARAAGQIPDEDSSEYAAEGTLAHEVVGAILTSRQSPECPAEMRVYAEEFCAFVLGLGGELRSEVRVSLFYSENERGTIDVRLIFRDASGRVVKIVIVDLKYGAGVGVYAFENKQLAIYAESAIREVELADDVSPDTPVELYIYQPRDRNDPNSIREWETTRGNLAMFCMAIQDAVATIEAFPDNEFYTPDGDACQFCPVKKICAARSAWVTGELPADPGEPMPLAGTMTREQRVRVLLVKKQLVSWLEDIEDKEREDLLAGAPVIGLKLVEGKSNRQWADEEAAKQLLRNHLSAEQTNPPSELISPAQAEKLLKGIELSTKFENKFAALIVKPDGKPTLVPESDKRPALMPKIEFEKLDETEALV
jgi:hypothetical protein